MTRIDRARTEYGSGEHEIAALEARLFLLRVIDDEDRARASEAHHLTLDEPLEPELVAGGEVTVEHLRLQYARKQLLVEARLFAPGRGRAAQPVDGLREVLPFDAEALLAEVVGQTGAAQGVDQVAGAGGVLFWNVDQSDAEAVALEVTGPQLVGVPARFQHLDRVGQRPLFGWQRLFRQRQPLARDRVFVFQARVADVALAHARGFADDARQIGRGESPFTDANVKVFATATRFVERDLVHREVFGIWTQTAAERR